MRLETPAGIVEGTVVTGDDGRIITVKLVDVPSFAYALDRIIDVPGIGKLRVDIGYGGNFFVIAQAVDVGFASIDPENTSRLIEAGIAMRNAANDQIKVQHPLLPHIDRIDIAMFTAAPTGTHADARNVDTVDVRQKRMLHFNLIVRRIAHGNTCFNQTAGIFRVN